MIVPPPQVIEAAIRNDAIDPRVEGAFKSEVGEFPVRAQKRFLADVLCIVLGPGKMDRQPEDLDESLLIGVLLTALFRRPRTYARTNFIRSRRSEHPLYLEISFSV
jgi:hypothetical protein